MPSRSVLFRSFQNPSKIQKIFSHSFASGIPFHLLQQKIYRL